MSNELDIEGFQRWVQAVLQGMYERDSESARLVAESARLSAELEKCREDAGHVLSEFQRAVIADNIGRAQDIVWDADQLPGITPQNESNVLGIKFVAQAIEASLSGLLQVEAMARTHNTAMK